MLSYTNGAHEIFCWVLCCEFICKLDYKLFPEQGKKLNFNKEKFESDLLKIGDSVVLVIDED